jgi:hypothetical protein
MSDFYLGVGDTSSPLNDTLKDATGAAVDIAGATITFTLTPIKGATAVVNAQAVTNLQVGDGSDGSKGKVRYTWVSPQTNTPGDYLGVFKVTFAGGAIQTYPNSGFILVTIQPVAPVTAGVYLTLEEFKKSMSATGAQFIDSDAQIAITAASRALDEAYGRYSNYWSLSSAGLSRFYTRLNDREVMLDDVIAVTTVALDYGAGDIGPGTYGTVLASTDYRLLPIQNGLAAGGGNGEPYHRLQLSRAASQYFFPQGTDAIKITGQYGFETVPAGVKNATTIIASRLLRRSREAPFGVLSVGLDGAAIRAGQIARDPEVAFAMDPISPMRIPV